MEPFRRRCVPTSELVSILIVTILIARVVATGVVPDRTAVTCVPARNRDTLLQCNTHERSVITMSIVMIVSNMIECYYGIPRPGVPLLRLLLLLVPSAEIPGYEILSFCATPTILYEYVPKDDVLTIIPKQSSSNVGSNVYAIINSSNWIC